MIINVIGGGLAGSEAAIYLAKNGIEVNLYEARPKLQTGAHVSSDFAELVCSNSLGSFDPENASGLLKHEALLMGSTLFKIALENKVPSGGSLSVDRVKFHQDVTELIKSYPNIKIINEEYTEINLETPTIIASGPLTSKTLSQNITHLFGEENFSFYDAIAPIVKKDSIDFSSAFYASRWDKGDADYINCPLNKEEYENFYNILINAERIECKSFEAKFFESCLPIEVLASRGIDTLRFGPMKPVGLFDKRIPTEFKRNQFYAVIQLRQDNKIADLYNLVGFQTNLKWGEQKRLLQSVPALKNCEIARYGVMHANTFINSPKILNKTLQSKKYPNLFFAGQLTGVEGYSESITTGLFAAINILKYLNSEKMIELSDKSMLGALLSYITYPEHKNFQPINSNWGIINKEELPKKISKDKKQKNKFLSDMAINYIKSMGFNNENHN